MIMNKYVNKTIIIVIIIIIKIYNIKYSIMIINNIITIIIKRNIEYKYKLHNNNGILE